MKTVTKVKLGDNATVESAFDWEVTPDGKELAMRIDARVIDGDYRLSWHDQFALLDAAWLALVDIRRAERRHRRRAKAEDHPGYQQHLLAAFGKDSPRLGEQ